MNKFYTGVYRHKSKIYHKYYNPRSDSTVVEKCDLKPDFFIRDMSSNESKYRSLKNIRLEKMQFNNIWDASQFLKNYKDVDNYEIYGMENYISQFILQKYPGEIKYNPKKIKILYYDIETESENGFPDPSLANEVINAWTFFNNQTETVICCSLFDYDPKLTEIEDIDPKNIYHLKAKDELELLRLFLKYFKRFSPDVLSGWYIGLFDNTYVINRMKKMLNEDEVLSLSPIGVINSREVYASTFSREKTITYDIVGVESLDYIDVFKKFGLVYGPQESYSLNHISNLVLNEKKMSYEEYGSLHNLYTNNPQKYVDYNIKDTYLIKKLEGVLKYLELIFEIAYMSGSNYSDVLKTVPVWDNMIYRELQQKNIIVPMKKTTYREDFPGGYVKQPLKGVKEWIASFDVNSMYPNLIVMLNMSPETIMEGLERDVSVETLLGGKKIPNNGNYSIAANGVRFSREKRGEIATIVRRVYEQRKVIQAEMKQFKKDHENPNDEQKQYLSSLDNKQKAVKILMNSLYGCLGNEYFRYFDNRIAEAVTLTGQYVIKYSEKVVNEYLNDVLKLNNEDHVVAIDTDSLYISLAPIVDAYAKDKTLVEKIDFVDGVCTKRLLPVLEKAYSKIDTQLNSFENRMMMKREVIASAGIWTTKKRYILNVLDEEGYRPKEPKMKIVGIEAIRSSTPTPCKEAMKECFKIIMNGSETDLHKKIAEFREEYENLKPEDIASPKSVNNLEKYELKEGFKSGTPQHVKGSIIYNRELKKRNMENYDKIKSGDKIKTLYLKMPNVMMNECVAFPSFLPKEFELECYIDRNKQFNKTFLVPLEPFFEATGWYHEERPTLF